MRIDYRLPTTKHGSPTPSPPVPRAQNKIGSLSMTLQTAPISSRDTLRSSESANGRFGSFGGRYVPETLMYALRQLSDEYDMARLDRAFQEQFQGYLRDFVGRPSRLYFA